MEESESCCNSDVVAESRRRDISGDIKLKVCRQWVLRAEQREKITFFKTKLPSRYMSKQWRIENAPSNYFSTPQANQEMCNMKDSK